MAFENQQIEGFNPLTGEKTLATRRRLTTNYNLPISEDYRQWLQTIIT